jgi:hypothetical protein
MSSFGDRLSIGTAHEQRVAGELRARGWTVDPWGQGVLSAEVRAAIRHSGSRLRFLPDLIAARNGELVTIDCKDRMRSADSGRYSIARQCVNFGIQMAALDVPLFYVFGNLAVLLPTEVMAYGRIGPRVTGSGAYYLVPERLGHQFDDVFGTPEVMAAVRVTAPR